MTSSKESDKLALRSDHLAAPRDGLALPGSALAPRSHFDGPECVWVQPEVWAQWREIARGYGTKADVSGADNGGEPYIAARVVAGIRHDRDVERENFRRESGNLRTHLDVALAANASLKRDVDALAGQGRPADDGGAPW